MKFSSRFAIKVCVVWMFLVVGLLTIGTFTSPGLETPVARAMTGMIWGLVLIWVGRRRVADVVVTRPGEESGSEDSP